MNSEMLLTTFFIHSLFTCILIMIRKADIISRVWTKKAKPVGHYPDVWPIALYETNEWANV